MLGLKTLRARQLSRKGEHTTALVMCGMKDVQVLSRAGMHLSVLELSKGPSIERALALAHVGEIDSALDMARLFLRKREAKPLWGFLATQVPEKVLQIIQNQSGYENVRAYCKCALGDIDGSLVRMKKLSTLHAMNVALNKADVDLARQYFEKLFTESGLVIPDMDWSSPRLVIASLSNCTSHLQEADGPLVSVILTAYNEETLLPMAVRSILHQEWSHLELILVDDGSQDRTFAVAKALAEQDQRIRVIRLSNNVGTWQAKNIAMKEARGAFITMHDADDWSHPAKLSQQIAPLLRKSELLCTSSYFFRIDEETGRPFTRNANSFMRWNPSSLLFRREVIQQIGSYRDGLLGSDCEFAARIEAHWGVHSHQRIRKPLAIGLQRKASLSNRHRFRNEGVRRLKHWEQWRCQHVRNLSTQLHCYADDVMASSHKESGY